MKRKKLLKKCEKQTKKSQRLAKQLAESQALNQFYAMWTHELRSPLSVVESTLAQLKAQSLQLNKEAADHQAWWLLETAVQHMSMSVNDLLGLAQVSHQRLTIQSQSFDLQTLLRELEAMSVRLVGKKPIELDVSLPQESVWLKGDAFRLKQVLLNLLANALKFTQQGQVRLDWQAYDSGIEFRIKDSGPGLAASELGKLFQPFNQLVQTQAGETIGSGLGLFIVQSLVAAMQGKIRVESELGQGTSFIVWLPVLTNPLAQPDVFDDRPKKHQKPEVRPSKLRVLLADDSELSRALLVSQLTQPELEWVETQDGEQALQWLENSEFDYVVLDRFMPKLDGEQLCQKIRQLQMAGQQVNLKGVYLISAEPSLVDQLNPCFDCCFIKPVDPLQLIKRFGLSNHSQLNNPKKDDCKNFIHDKIPSDLTEMLPKFIKEVDYLLGEVEQCVKASQYQNCRDWMHRLKGSFMLFQQDTWLVDLEGLETAIQHESVQDSLERLHKIRSQVLKLQATCEL
ncbi:MAG: hybrid sensor histidine kinase/response regulator [Thiomicrospira sp.]|uniref:hybrid sensor histidine kinase/response regulator n=1 Tax=Thiomicrospira sp. TaxID=935 RepID=UPI0019E36D9C|nr:hybrid sensor histidine kinase/response regulator [Thiomicrospira sp.]MBE0492961.1 hybrid sensor histidine kinase/response regulator [Thiomicrospira sp.]